MKKEALLNIKTQYYVYDEAFRAEYTRPDSTLANRIFNLLIDHPLQSRKSLKECFCTPRQQIDAAIRRLIQLDLIYADRQYGSRRTDLFVAVAPQKKAQK